MSLFKFCGGGILFLLPMAASQVTQEKWTKLTIPPDYWQPINASDEAIYGTFFDCAFGCLIKNKTDCHGFKFDEVKSNCTLGKLVPTWTHNNYIPDYIHNGTKVWTRRSLVHRSALAKVPRVHRLNHENLGGYGDDALMDGTRLMEVRVPLEVVRRMFFAVLPYRDGFLVCGGRTIVGNWNDRKCRIWSWKTREWTELPGQTIYSHFEGNGCILHGRLYLFFGRPAWSVYSPQGLAESYDLATDGPWKAEPSTSITMLQVEWFQAVPIEENSKILLVGGKRPGTFMYSRYAYLFDTVQGTYTRIPGELEWASAGISCEHHPDLTHVVVCAGAYNWNTGQLPYPFSEKVYLIDAVAGSILPYSQSNDLPLQVRGHLLPYGGHLFMVAESYNDYKATYKMIPGETETSVSWEEVEGGAQVGTPILDYETFLYQMDYHELLLP